MQWVIGIDEAGRGPLAGPVAVGAVALPMSKNEWALWEGLKDSKKLSEKKREAWFGRIKEENLCHAVSLVGASVIHAEGIVHAVRLAARCALESLKIEPREAMVMLDKNIRVPDKWTQEEFVKGDERFPVIALASIVAKVTRDAHMILLDKKYPGYGFAIHKGYGTKAHYAAIDEMGACAVHRHGWIHKR